MIERMYEVDIKVVARRRKTSNMSHGQKWQNVASGRHCADHNKRQYQKTRLVNLHRGACNQLSYIHDSYKYNSKFRTALISYIPSVATWLSL